MSNNSFLSRAFKFLFNRNEDIDTPTIEKETNSSSLSKDTSVVSDTIPNEGNSEMERSCVSTTSQSSFLKPDVEKKSTFIPNEVMKALGVEILENGGDGYFLVGFQGGVFVLSFEEERINIMYNDVCECSYDDTVKASLVANEINSTYAVWSCYLRTSPRGTTGLPVKVCFSQMLPLIGTFNETIDFIHGVMASAFSVAREFRERFKKAQHDNSNLANILNQKDFVYKLELAKRLMEVHNYDEIKEEMPPASYLRIDMLADLFNDTEFGKPESMKIIAGDEMAVVADSNEISEFDIRTYVRNHPQRDNLQSITFVVSFEKQDLVVCLKKMLGSSKKSLFFVLNIMRSGVDDDIVTHNRTIISFRDTIEIRLTNEQEDYWEVKYMIDEARDKHNTNNISNLSDEQKMMLIQLLPNVQDDLYWGLKFFNQDCLYQSLFYFKRIFYNFFIAGNHEKKYEDTFADVCLYIGIVYCQLRKYELAYYFLDKTKKYDSILASEWYTNCLCNLKDDKALRYIKRMIETVSHNLEDNDIDTDLRNDLFKYYLFLKRRLVQTLVAEQRLTEAENVLIRMIDRNENVDFCKMEQKVIQQLRNSKADEELRTKGSEKIQKEKMCHSDIEKEDSLNDDDIESEFTN